MLAILAGVLTERAISIKVHAASQQVLRCTIEMGCVAKRVKSVAEALRQTIAFERRVEII
jgi:hypothetical protein